MHSIIVTLTLGGHGNVGLFLEGQVLAKSNENLFFYRGKFQSQVSIARVVLVLFEAHVPTRVEKTTGFTEGMRTASSNTTCAFASFGVACSEPGL